VDVVLDTDTFNEIDDQFALVYAALSADKLRLRAVHAAPFHNDRSEGPGDGMAKSHAEILRLFDLLGLAPEGAVFKGSTRFTDEEAAPESSEATENLIRLARSMPEGRPLYVAAIAALTNIANALRLAPDLIDRIVVVWLGGHPLYCADNREFNLKQDPCAVRSVLDSGVPFILIPCAHVAEFLRTTEPEMRALLKGRGSVADALYRLYVDYMGGEPATSKVIWDLAPVAWLLEGGRFESSLVSAPTLGDTEPFSWESIPDRHPIRVCTRVHRDWVFRDFARRVSEHVPSTKE
jgi:inosine-uridine nucleoside N-ribohydrolase